MHMIEIEHNGHSITYSENADTWECYSLNVSANTLSALKAKINKIDADSRRLNGVSAIRLFYNGECLPCTVLMVDGDKLWIHGKNSFGKVCREKVDAYQLLDDSPESREKIAAYKAALNKHAEERERIEAMKAALPRFKVPEIVPVGKGET